MKLKMSVVIPAFNEEKYIENTLNSLKHQTFKDFEIIVADNNSTDKTETIAKKYGARVVKEERQGNTFAVATGMKEAQGEIIATTDADTVVSKNWLEVIYKAFENKDVVGATGMTDNNSVGDKMYEFFLAFNFLIGKPHLTGFNLAVRKSAFDKIGGLDTHFTMSPDVDLGLRIKEQGKVVFLRDMKVTTSYRRWQENPFGAFWDYFKGYFWTVWLRKPPPVKQNVIR